MGKGGRTTTKHKEDNTFRFERFEEKLRKISISIVSNIRDGRSYQVEEGESYFFQAVEKWIDLNSTKSFKDLLSSLGSDIKTFPQILHHKDHLIKTLKDHLIEENRASFQPTFELIIALARDLEKEFYPHLPDIFQLISTIVLNSKVPEEIEKGFQCVAYLFKYLKSYIVKDFTSYLKLIQPLLSSKVKKYVVIFACETFELIASKAAKRSPTEFLLKIFKTLLKKDPQYSSGVSGLLFYMIKGPSNKLREYGSINFKDCLQMFNILTNNEEKLIWVDVMKILIENLISHLSLENTQSIWKEVEEDLSNTEIDQFNFDCYLNLYKTVFESHQEEKIYNLDERAKFLNELSKKDQILSANNQEILVEIFKFIFNIKPINYQTLSQFSPGILNLIKIVSYDLLEKFNITLSQTSWYFTAYFVTILEASEKYKKEIIGHENQTKNMLLFKIASGALLYKTAQLYFPPVENPMFTGIAVPSYYFRTKGRRFKSLGFTYRNMDEDTSTCCQILSESGSLFQFQDTSSLSKIVEDQLLRFFFIFPRLKDERCDLCYNKIFELFKFLSKDLLNQSCFNKIVHIIYFFLSEAIALNFKDETFEKSEEELNLFKTMPKFISCQDKTTFSLWILKSLDMFLFSLTRANYEKNSKFAHSILTLINENENELLQNLASGNKIVRVLTLSILFQNESLKKEGEDVIFYEFLRKALEFENLNVIEIEFLSRAKEILNSLPVILANPSLSKKTIKFILNYIMGIMNMNNSQLWPECIRAICLIGNSKIMDFEYFWNNMYSIIFKLHKETTGTKLLATSNRDTTDFIEKLEINTFGLLHNERGFSEVEENLDIEQYKNNIWKILCSFANQTTFNKLAPIIKDFLSSQIIANFGLKLDSETPAKTKTILPILEYLSCLKPSLLDEQINNFCSDLLIAPPKIRTAALKVLMNSKQKHLSSYKDSIESLNNNTSTDVLHEFRSDSTESTIKSNDRKEVMDVVIRILIGREKFTKNSKIEPVIRFISSCLESEAKYFIDLYIGEELDNLKSVKYLEVRLLRIINLFKTWRYTFPNLLLSLVQTVLKITKKIFSYENEEDADLRKRALKAARISIVTFFELFPKLNFDNDQIFFDNLFDVFIWDQLNYKEKSGSSISWILKLFNIWSIHPRFHMLLTKNNEAGNSPMHCLINLIKDPSVNETVKKYALSIIFNLSSSQEQSDLEDVEEVQAINAKLIPQKLKLDKSGFLIDIDDSSSVGYSTILYFKNDLLNIFSVKGFLKKMCSDIEITNQCLNLISKLSEVSENDETWNQEFSLIIIDSLTIFKRTEEGLLNCFDTLKKLMKNISDPNHLILKLGYCFTWVKDGRLRTSLCSVLDSQPNKFIAEHIQGINSLCEKTFETPDFTKRQNSYQCLRDEIRKGFEPILFTLTAFNCFHNILQETDLAMRNSSINLLEEIAYTIKREAVENKEVHEFLENVILKRLKAGIQHKEENRFHDFIRVLSTFSITCLSHHGALKEVEKLFDPEAKEGNILEGIRNIKIHIRTRAMNKLSKRIEEIGNELSPSTLNNYARPIATHNILDENKLGEQRNELIDSSIMVVKTILLKMPYEIYFKQLTNLLDNSNKNARLVKQFERILIASMEAFHFDLTNGVEKIEKNVKEEPKKNMNNKMETDEHEKEDNDNDFHKKLPDCTELTVLTKTASIKCLGTLKRSLIPKLKRYLHFEEKAMHKLSGGSKDPSEDVIRKIPCTLALVKLLKKLPQKESSDAIRSIIPSLCAGLKSRIIPVRDSLRRTILSVLKEIGTSQFRTAFNYLKSSLQRGYQKHVLNYTLSFLTKALEKEFNENPQHFPANDIVLLCEEEIFGVMKEEKTLSEVREKTKEARMDNAHPLLKYCSTYTKSKLDHLIESPLKQLNMKKSADVAKEVRLWLLNISEGLSLNKTIDNDTITNWLLELLKKYEDTSNNSDNNNKNTENSQKKKSKYLTEIKDCRELVPIFQKSSITSGKNVSQTVIKEFVFNCLYLLLKRGAFTDELILLDSFTHYLCNGLQDSSKNVNVVSMRCLLLLIEYDLESFKDSSKCENMWKGVFVAMNKYCFRSSTDIEMINSTFNFMKGFCIKFPDFKMLKKDFDIILRCIQSYMNSDNCSTSALTLLKGILKNKYNSTELNILMEEIAKQTIQSPYQHVNESCKQVYLEYLKGYCTSPQLFKSKLEFFVNQLNYENYTGRYSAIEIVNSIITITPDSLLDDVRIVFFLKMLFALDIENIEACRVKLCNGLQLLFQKNDPEDEIFKTLLSLLKNEDHIGSQRTLVQVAGVMIEHGSNWKENNLKKLFKCFTEILKPRILSEIGDITQTERDHAIYMTILAFKKFLKRNFFGVLLGTKSYKKLTEEILEYLKDYIKYDHDWVQYETIMVFQTILNEYKSDLELTANTFENENEDNDLKSFIKTPEDLLKLIRGHISVIKFASKDLLRDSAISGLSILLSLTAFLQDSSVMEDSFDSLRKMINYEVRIDPQCSNCRSKAIFAFGYFANNAPIESLKKVIRLITRIIVRDITDNNSPNEVKKLSEELVDILRNKFEENYFNMMYSEINSELTKKRINNKAKKQEQVVLNPGKVRKRKNVKVKKFKGKIKKPKLS